MRPTILTIDDSKALRLFVQKALGAFDCEVNETSNGYNAFFAIERVRPDLILLDVAMPVMDGVETLTRLKAAPELVAIPVIMLTSPADHAVVSRLTALGAAGILQKPFDEAALIGRIRGVIDLKPAKPKPV